MASTKLTWKKLAWNDDNDGGGGGTPSLPFPPEPVSFPAVYAHPRGRNTLPFTTWINAVPGTTRNLSGMPVDVQTLIVFPGAYANGIVMPAGHTAPIRIMPYIGPAMAQNSTKFPRDLWAVTTLGTSAMISPTMSGDSLYGLTAYGESTAASVLYATGRTCTCGSCYFNVRANSPAALSLGSESVETVHTFLDCEFGVGVGVTVNTLTTFAAVFTGCSFVGTALYTVTSAPPTGTHTFTNCAWSNRGATAITAGNHRSGRTTFRFNNCTMDGVPLKDLTYQQIHGLAYNAVSPIVTYVDGVLKTS